MVHLFTIMSFFQLTGRHAYSNWLVFVGFMLVILLTTTSIVGTETISGDLMLFLLAIVFIWLLVTATTHRSVYQNDISLTVIACVLIVLVSVAGTFFNHANQDTQNPVIHFPILDNYVAAERAASLATVIPLRTSEIHAARDTITKSKQALAELESGHWTPQVEQILATVKASNFAADRLNITVQTGASRDPSEIAEEMRMQIYDYRQNITVYTEATIALDNMILDFQAGDTSLTPDILAYHETPLQPGNLLIVAKEDGQRQRPQHPTITSVTRPILIWLFGIILLAWGPLRFIESWLRSRAHNFYITST